MEPTAPISAQEQNTTSEKKPRTAEQQIRLERHHAKKSSATDQLRQKIEALGDDALLDEYEAAGYVGKSVQWMRNHRINGGGLPFIKVGSAVRYRFGNIKTYLTASDANTADTNH